jgi:hypothetical protein
MPQRASAFSGARFNVATGSSSESESESARTRRLGPGAMLFNLKFR